MNFRIISLIVVILHSFVFSGCISTMSKNKENIFKSDIVSVKLLDIKRSDSFTYGNYRYTPKDKNAKYVSLDLAITNETNENLKYIPGGTLVNFENKKSELVFKQHNCCAFYPYFFIGFKNSFMSIFRVIPSPQETLEPGETELRKFVFQEFPDDKLKSITLQSKGSIPIVEIPIKE